MERSTTSFEWLNLNKFNRLITIGCSFTDYRYPTWANIMSSAMPHAEFINLGRGGAGNMFISNRITEAHRKLNLCETDLIMVLWSTHCREDRYIDGSWLSPGNIYTQSHYDEKFVKDFCQPLGYLIRDLSLIDLSNIYLNTLPCTYVGMISVPFDYQQDINDKTNEVFDAYQETIDYFPPNMFELEMNNEWTTNIFYEVNGKIVDDYHPTPMNYYNYLNKLGIKLNDTALQYAAQSDTLLRSVKSIHQIRQSWPNLDLKTAKGFW